MYPGQAPTIRRILFNVMVVLDLSRPESLHFTANTISMLVDRSYPTRIDFAAIVETEDGVKMARVFYYLTQNYSRLATIKFFRSVSEPMCIGYFTYSLFLRQVLDLQGEKDELDWSNIQAQFETLVSSEEIQEGGEPMSFDALGNGSSEVFEERINKARAYARRPGTDSASSLNGRLFINGKYYVIDDVRSPNSLFQRALTHFHSCRTS
jgi:UDP-glucose:glycoprotein glucosyltransferase